MFGLFDRHRSTDRSYTVSVFAVSKYDLPSPTTAISQLKDGIFKSLVLHQSPSARAKGGIDQLDLPVCSLVNLKASIHLLGDGKSQY